MENRQLTPDCAAFQQLCELVETLCGPAGCPWDREQSPLSISRYLIEEAFELVDAVQDGEPEAVCEELGDVLFLLLFLAHLHAQQGHFSLGAVLETITAKMVRRHPHVFGRAEIKSSSAVRRNWSKIKQAEKKRPDADSLLDAIPKSAPALMRAYKISARIAGAGMDPRSPSEICSSAADALSRFQTVLAQDDMSAADRAFGELLLKLVSSARAAGVHPEISLAGALKQFEGRFRRLEKEMGAEGRSLEPRNAEDCGRMVQCMEGDRLPRAVSEDESRSRPPTR